MTTFLILLLLAFTSVSLAQKTIYCRQIEDPNLCYIVGETLSRDDLRYDVVPFQPVSTTTQLYFNSNKIAVFSQDFCHALPNTEIIIADAQEIEILDQDAFVSCRRLRILDLTNNLIQILPENIVRFNPSLQQLLLQSNQLVGVPDLLLEKNPLVERLTLSHNRIGSFPVKIIQQNRFLKELFLSTNEISDLQVDEILSYLSELEVIAITKNIFPCSRVAGMVEALNYRGVKIEEDLGQPRERVYRMSSVLGVECVDGH